MKEIKNNFSNKKVNCSSCWSFHHSQRWIAWLGFCSGYHHAPFRGGPCALGFSRFPSFLLSNVKSFEEELKQPQLERDNTAPLPDSVRTKACCDIWMRCLFEFLQTFGKRFQDMRGKQKEGNIFSVFNVQQADNTQHGVTELHSIKQRKAGHSSLPLLKLQWL